MQNMSELHRFSRTELLIGPAGLETLRQKQVAVAGLGGVGSYTVEALARSGIGSLVLVDFDTICLTNTNRQLHAISGNYGQAKVEVMAERVKAINPQIDIQTYHEFITAENIGTIFKPGISYVVDAIDTVYSKVDLIIHCLQSGIPIISCMGTGNKFDPLAFRIDDISNTHTCPLAKAVRKTLREKGISQGVKVVYSIEKPIQPDSDVPTCHQNCICPKPDEQVWNCTRRRQIPGSTSYLPPIAGLIMAGEVIRELLKINQRSKVESRKPETEVEFKS